VQADIYAMPEGAAYSFAKNVRWKSGRPLELAIFVSGAVNPEDHRTITVTHELYHLLAAFLRIGRWTINGAGRPNASIGFEEIAATSFASCGALLADGYLSRPRANNTIVLNGIPMKQPLSANEVTQLLAGGVAPRRRTFSQRLRNTDWRPPRYNARFSCARFWPRAHRTAFTSGRTIAGAVSGILV
jgi:hypothetical protein